jgi:hypothetical protein
VGRTRLLVSLLSIACTAAVTAFAVTPAHAAGPRVTLRVLVVSDGQTQTAAIAGQLASEGVPYTVVDLTSASRPVINTAFLQDTVSGVPRAKFQAVVLPNENPFGNATELAALTAFEAQFGVRQVDAYVYPSPAVGLNYPTYAGNLDGSPAVATTAARAGALRYLKGSVKFEDNSPVVDESYGYPVVPLADDPAHTAHFEPYLTTPVPGVFATTGSLAGVYSHDGRNEMVMTFAYNGAQQQFKLIAHGLVTWMTKGIHFGYDRNYFAVHVDDVFLPDARWSTAAHCTPGEGCPIPAPGQPEVSTEDIRMIPADVTQAIKWQQQRGFAFDMLFNGGGSDEEITLRGSDPLAEWFVANRTKFRWANHTYQHPFLGCVQDYTVVPWKCVTNAQGAIQYVSQAEIVSQINTNKTWGAAHGLTLDAGELVTGEHSGMKVLPQQPLDNPNLAAAFTQAGVLWAGSDNSRDPQQRTIGSARTVPRHPMNIFFNVASMEEEVNEYNWIYASRANGGSGICEDNAATTTCIAPLNESTGFQSYIVPLETRIAFSHIINNDPRPHYVHQSNLTDDRIIYPVLNSILDTYNATFASTTPVVNQRMSAIGTQFVRDAAWKAAVAAGTASAYTQDGKVYVSAPNTTLDLPLTMPEGTRRGTTSSSPVFGEKYAGERSIWDRASGSPATLTLTLPAGATN